MSSPGKTDRKRVRWGRAVVISVLFVAVTFPFVWWFSPAGHQWRVMRIAQAHLDGPMKEAASHAQAIGLSVFVSTAEQIWVIGSLSCRTELEPIREAIRASHPPCPVRYHIVFPDGSFEESTEPAISKPLTGD